MHIGYTQILDRTYPGPQGPQALATRLINITEGVIEGFGRFIREHPHPMPVTVVSDPNTHQAAGKALMASLTHAEVETCEVLLPDPEPKADDHTLRDLQSLIPDETAFLIACGSGTINDLVKMAAFERGLRYGVVPTAASMNGYTSTISALTVEGVKRTLPAQPPAWVAADLGVVRAAPPEMAGAGFADLLSKTTASNRTRPSIAVGRSSPLATRDRRSMSSKTRSLAPSALAKSSHKPERAPMAKATVKV